LRPIFSARGGCGFFVSIYKSLESLKQSLFGIEQDSKQQTEMLIGIMKRRLKAFELYGTKYPELTSKYLWIDPKVFGMA